MQTPQIVHRTTQTERLFFLSKPDLATRKSLRQAGWRYDLRGSWWRHVSNVEVLKPKALEPLLIPQQQPEAATA